MSMEHCDVLIVDPDSESAERARRPLEQNGYAVVSTSELGKALEVMGRFGPHVVLLNPLLEGYKPAEVADIIRRQSFGTMLIIWSDAEYIHSGDIHLLSPVFDHLDKESKDLDILSVVRNAIQHYHETYTMQGVTDLQARLRRQLDFMILKESERRKNRFQFYTAVTESLRHSMNQGSGLGGLISAIDLLEATAETDGDKTVIDSGMFARLTEQRDAAVRWLDQMAELRETMSRKFRPERIAFNELKDIIQDVVLSASDILAVKKNQAVVELDAKPMDVYCNKDLLRLSIRELILNACKFSPENTNIAINLHLVNGYISLHIKNEVLPNGNRASGIPRESELQIFEPFYRLDNTLDDRYAPFTLGIGLGLTFVQSALNRLSAKINAYQAKGGAAGAADDLIVAEMLLPTTAIARIDSLKKHRQEIEPEELTWSAAGKY